MNRNWIGSLIIATTWLPIAGDSEKTSHTCSGKKSSINHKTPDAPVLDHSLENKARPKMISSNPVT
tara:strand:+ start:245 stop:442 length:198 start_codon:yes stop_codon:yes gene_type:complete